MTSLFKKGPETSTLPPKEGKHFRKIFFFFFLFLFSFFIFHFIFYFSFVFSPPRGKVVSMTSPFLRGDRKHPPYLRGRENTLGRFSFFSFFLFLILRKLFFRNSKRKKHISPC